MTHATMSTRLVKIRREIDNSLSYTWLRISKITLPFIHSHMLRRQNAVTFSQYKHTTKLKVLERQLYRIKSGAAKSAQITLFGEVEIVHCHLKHKCLPLLFFIATFGCTGECKHLCIKTTLVGPNIAMNKQIIKKEPILETQ